MNGNIIDILNRRFEALSAEKDYLTFTKLERGYILFLGKNEFLRRAIESMTLKDRTWTKALNHFIYAVLPKTDSKNDEFELPKFISKKLKNKFYFPEHVSYYKKEEQQIAEYNNQWRSRTIWESGNYLQYEATSLIQEFHLALLEELSESKIKTKFDTAESLLNLQGKEVLISKSKDSKAHYLLETLFKNPSHVWSFDEIAEDWGSKDFVKEDWKKYSNAVTATNRIIAMETTIKNFLEASTKNVKINSKYL